MQIIYLMLIQNDIETFGRKNDMAIRQVTHDQLCAEVVVEELLRRAKKCLHVVAVPRDVGKSAGRH